MSQVSLALKAAADASGLSVRALQYAIEDGLLKAHYYNGTKPVIRVADLDEYIQSLPTARKAD